MSKIHAFKTISPRDSDLDQIERIDRDLKFKNALSRIINPEEKIKKKQWHETEWGFLYVTPEQYIKFLIKRAGDDC